MFNEVLRKIKEFNSIVKTSNTRKLKKVYRLYDTLISQYVYLSAMNDYIEHNGRSRGSALYTDQSGKKPYDSSIFYNNWTDKCITNTGTN